MKLKIALILERFLPSLGGAEQYAHWLATSLVQRGLEVHIFAERGLVEPPLIFHGLSLPKKPKSYRIFYFAQAVKRAVQKAGLDISMALGKGLGMDIYQPHGGVHWSNLHHSYRLSRHFPWLRQISKIFSLKQWAFLLLERLQYRSTSRFIALSKMVKGDMIQYYHLAPQQIDLVYNGVDTEKFSLEKREFYQRTSPSSLPGRDPKKFTLLFLGHNFSLKGLSCAIKALEILKKQHPAIRLLVAGRGRSRWYKFLSRKCQKDVCFLGSVSEPEYLYAISDVLIHPTFYDPCSLVCMEALASGLPVITTKYNGVSELMDGSGGSVLPDPHNHRGFACAVSKLLDRSTWETVSSQAYRIGSQYTLQKNVQNLLEIFYQYRKKKEIFNG